MNQGDFRDLVSSGSGGNAGSNTTGRGFMPKTGWGSSARNTKTSDVSQPVFKPRKTKKKADVKDTPEKTATEKSHIFNVEEYEKLGTAKGLDLELLEQNRAKLASSTEDDELLENAFQGTVEPSEPAPESTDDKAVQAKRTSKKRTRQELLDDLKANRSKVEGGDHDTTSQSRFKPIGTPKLGDVPTKKRKKVKKVKPTETALPATLAGEDPTCSSAEKSNQIEETMQTADDQVEVDIFAGMGEYEGFGDDEDEQPEATQKSEHEQLEGPDTGNVPVRQNWFQGDEDENNLESGQVKEDGEAVEVVVEDKPVSRFASPQHERLQPLASTSIQSISAFLAADEGFEAEAKKKAKRDKRKGRRHGET